MKCEDCIFWYVHYEIGGELGECRRYPPTVILNDWKETVENADKSFSNSLWPIVHNNDCCGEFKQKKINNIKKGDRE